MADVKEVVAKLTEQTKAGIVPWHEVGDGRGDLEGHRATYQGVEFEIFLDRAQLRINQEIVSHQDSVPFGDLRAAIYDWLRQSSERRRSLGTQHALEAAARALGC